ncbi:hypothetical protein OP10G_2918 [Fimbriimonas ginsengisoli Gsoil 348]|uniref:Uncharacterized protein n=1 Tax=Fimbriimonas ginsengisoli Gsoil 348 TaxID=661478 RepID=A0A068NS61_FIMGI|nr:hypothetical protein OP10G_2918 [Fimbriimonas ginsengisoli Gsoil 348]
MSWRDGNLNTRVWISPTKGRTLPDGASGGIGLERLTANR